jgi:hypothetical protein
MSGAAWSAAESASVERTEEKCVRPARGGLQSAATRGSAPSHFHMPPIRNVAAIDLKPDWPYPFVHTMTLSLHACRIGCACFMRAEAGVRDESVI